MIWQKLQTVEDENEQERRRGIKFLDRIKEDKSYPNTNLAEADIRLKNVDRRNRDEKFSTGLV